MASAIKKAARIIPLDRFKGWIFSAFFGIVVVVTFYTLRNVIPARSQFYNEIVTILFILLSVFILFPARELLMKRILKKSEYDRLFGGDDHHLDLIARQFTVETIVEEIFPELLSWLKCRSGRIAIRNADRRTFTFYVYRRGRLRKRQISEFHIFDQLTRQNVGIKGPYYADDPSTPEEIRSIMERFNTVLFQPIQYRRSFPGFIMLNEPPRHQYSLRALDLFARKAAVSIHNQHLSDRIIDNPAFDREFMKARRIRHLLQSSQIPEIPGFHLKNLRKNKSLSILEIFPGREGEWFFVFICSPRLTNAAGIVLAGALGHLYSFIARNEHYSLHRLMRYMRKEYEITRSEYRMDTLVGRLDLSDDSLLLMVDGNFQVYDSLKESDVAIPGWRSRLQFSRGSSCLIQHRREPLLEISRIRTPARGEVREFKPNRLHSAGES